MESHSRELLVPLLDRIRGSARAALAAGSVVLLTAGLGANLAVAQQDVTYRAAIVGLTDDADLRMSFEDGLATKARERRYDAVTSYDIEPKAANLDGKKFLKALEANGVRAVLMVRPAAIGPGSSLESVKNSVSPELFRDMQAFAKDVSPSGGQDLIAVVHLAIYTLDGGNPELISAGAVWLDEEVESQAQGIDRLQDLILDNVDAVRPAIRQHLGLPPLQ